MKPDFRSGYRVRSRWTVETCCNLDSDNKWTILETTHNKLSYAICNTILGYSRQLLPLDKEKGHMERFAYIIFWCNWRHERSKRPAAGLRRGTGFSKVGQGLVLPAGTGDSIVL